jgi:hypothetical protein
MANSFSKEERVAFEDILEGFNDALVLSRNVSVYNTDGSMMERTNNVIYRPQPYIAQSFDGMDQTNNFTAYTQLSVPATLGFQKSVPFILDALNCVMPCKKVASVMLPSRNWPPTSTSPS